MTPDPAIYIIAASILSGTIGFLGACILSVRRISRTEKDTWAAANRYYTRRYSKEES